MICTPDKDLGQCVGGKVVQWDRRQDKWFDAAGVHARLGVQPASIPDYLALVGDSADGFPGIPGWGSKSAAGVLDRWGHLEDIPDDPVTWDAGVRNAGRLNLALREQFELALLFRRIATVDPDAPVNADLDELEWRGPTADLRPMCEALGAATLADRADKLASALSNSTRKRTLPHLRRTLAPCTAAPQSSSRSCSRSSPRSPRKQRLSPPGRRCLPRPATPAGVCDPIDPAHCLLPFPNDFFTVADPASDTGRRVNLSSLALPTNVAGKPWDPTEWNRNDGFSPGSPILTRVPGLNLRRTWAMFTDQLTDLERSLAPDAPIVLLDATTGARHPFWSELDTHPDTTDADRLLVIRPASNLLEGHRYVVALRRMRDSSDRLLQPSRAFSALRDRWNGGLATEARRPAMDRVFADLARAGVARSDLYLAWDFTVASERNLTERMLAMRDDVFAQLGDTDLADGVVQGDAPAFTITSVEDFDPTQNRATSRTVKGTISVPSYLTPQTSAAVPEPARRRGGLRRRRRPVAS